MKNDGNKQALPAGQLTHQAESNAIAARQANPCFTHSEQAPGRADWDTGERQRWSPQQRIQVEPAVQTGVKVGE